MNRPRPNEVAITFRLSPIGKLIPLADGKELAADIVSVSCEAQGTSSVTMRVSLPNGIRFEPPKEAA